MEDNCDSLSNIASRISSFYLMSNDEVQCDTVDCQNKTRFGTQIIVSKETSFIKLARAGFYYAGIESGIRCFTCHVEYNCWDKESPVGVHRILNPDCLYLNQDSSTRATNSLPQLVTNIKINLFPSDTQESHHSCTKSQQPSMNIESDDSQSMNETPPRPDSSSSTPESIAIQSVRRNLFPSDITNDVLVQRNTDNSSGVNLHLPETKWSQHCDEYTGKIIHPKIGDIKIMYRESFRILTFPDPTSNKAEAWAENGFIAFEQDCVRCVYCGECAAFDEASVKNIHQRISPVGRYCCPLVTGVDVGDVSCELEKLVRQKLIKRNSECTDSRNLYSILHPQYKSWDKRVMSFKFWSKQYKPTKNQLSEAGFFYTGVATKVVCFCCGVSLRDWEPTADSWQQHALISPTCSFIKHEKGEDFIQQMSRIEKLVDEDSAVTEPVAVMGDLIIPDPYPPTLDSTLLAAYSSCGYPPHLLLRLIQQIFKQTRGRYPSLDMLKAAILADGVLKKKEDLLDLQGEVIEKQGQQLDHVHQQYKTTVATINQEYCQQINNKEHQLHQKDHQLHQKDHQLHQKDHQLHQKDHQLHQKDHQHKQQLHQKDHQLHQQDHQLHQQDHQLHQKDHQLHQKDHQLHQKDHQHKQQLHQKDHQLHCTKQEKNDLCGRLQSAVDKHREREGNLVRNNSTLVQYNLTLEQYNSTLAGTNSTLLQKIERQQADTQREIEKYQKELSALTAEYTRLKSAGRRGNPVSPESWNDRICLFCVSEEKVVMFQPCRHICCCANCAPNFKNSLCPLCRVAIKDWEIVFLS